MDISEINCDFDSLNKLGGHGFAAVASAKHASIKALTIKEYTETYRIARVTSSNWKTAKKNDLWIQYVSLTGHHKKH